MSRAQVVDVPVTTQSTTAPATSPAAAVNSILNTTTPVPPTAVPIPATPAAQSTPSNLQPPLIPVPTVGKYEEYQSICRTNDYDTVAFFSDQLKQQRIQLIKDRILKNPTTMSYQLRLMKELADQKKLQELQATASELKAKKLSSPDQRMADAIVAFAKKDKKSARDNLNAILAENPKNVEALKLLAEVYINDKNYFESASIFFDLKKITNKNYDAALCESYVLHGHYPEAENYCFAEITKNKNPFASIFLGVASREQKKFKEAKKYFKNSLKTKETEMGHVCLGEMLDLEKNYAEAAASFEKAIAVVPKSDRARVALAWSFFKNGKRSEASENFLKACNLNSKLILEIRKALKILLDEKSESIATYSQILQKCESF